MLKVISIQTASVVTITASGENGGTCRLSVLGEREDAGAGLTARLRVNRPGARRGPGVESLVPPRVCASRLPLTPPASRSPSLSLSLSPAVPFCSQLRDRLRANRVHI